MNSPIFKRPQLISSPADIDDGSSPIKRRIIQINSPETERREEQLTRILRSAQQGDKIRSESKGTTGIKLA